jgi:SepF-like predicted cell division protein (DUF552 family)
MAGTSFGQLFRYTTWGESHGVAIGCVVDGVPPRRPSARDDKLASFDRSGVTLGWTSATVVRIEAAKPQTEMEMKALILAITLASTLMIAGRAAAQDTTPEIIERCRQTVGSMGANIVKVCVDQDIAAEKALASYPEEAREIVERCRQSVGSMGANIVKVCADQDVAAEKALRSGPGI